MDPNTQVDSGRSSHLSPQQLRMWLGQKLYPDVRLHNLATIYCLSGRIDLEHFRRAFQTLVDSSDALRTIIEVRHGVPCQGVLESIRRPVDFVDLSATPDPEAAAEAWAYSRAELQFEPSECLFDSALIKIGETRFLWFLHVHHSVFDGGSAALAARLLAQLYEKARAGTLADRVELPRFHDYLRSEREYAQSPEGERALAFWSDRLAAGMGALSFYGETPRKTKTAVERLSRTLTSAQMQRLDALAAKAGRYYGRITTFAILATVLSVLLCRIGGSRCFCIGTPFNNRRSAASRDTLGLLMQVVPLTIQVGIDDTFLSLLQRIERQAAECWLHAQHGVPKLLEQPAYDVVLNFQDLVDASLDGKPIRVKPLHPGHQLESLGIEINDPTQSGVLTLDFNLHCEAFPVERRELLVNQFFRVLDLMLEDPQRSIAGIDLLSDAEKRHLLVELNSRRLPMPRQLTFPALFEAQVERMPAAVAVVYEGETLNYDALNARANQLAWALRERGVAPETLVGVLLDSSLDVAVAFLGVYKAGGAILPLEPSYPTERTEFMLRDAGVRLLLTQTRLLPELPAFDGEILIVDLDRSAISQKSAEAPSSGLTPENLAYVNYTSGSTGAPKGVMLTQKNLCNRLLWGATTFNVGGGERYLQSASWAYDAALWALMEPWVGGGRTVIARSKSRADPKYLIELMAATQVTFLATTPTMLHALLKTGDFETCNTLRHVFAWGERLAPELADRFSRQSSAELYNVYGQTETCISALHWRCRAGASARPVPVGGPHANAQAYILDSELRPVPIGVPGELYIGGAGVARGYLDHAALTAERFLMNPFSDANVASATDGEARLFKTGDLARFAPDGTIECLGRIDRQVKIHGNRVELGEIEAALARHPEVRECVVIAHPAEADLPQAPADLRLVAYFVSQAPIQSEELRNISRRMLPGFMIPTAFVRLDALPLTRTGKIDERSLPAPTATDLEEPRALVQPRDLTEEIVARTWAEVLGVEWVNLEANFFDVGGDSLGGFQLLARLEETFELEMPMQWLIESPTISGMAAWIRQARDAGAAGTAEPASIVVGIRRTGSRLPFFFVPGGNGDERALLAYAHLARHLHHDQPFFGFQMRDLVAQDPTAAVEEVARLLLRDVKRIQPAGPYLLGGECHGGIVALEMAQQLRASGEDVSLLFLLDTVSPYGFRRAGQQFWPLRLAISHPRRLYRLMRRALKARRHPYLRLAAKYHPAPYAGSVDLLVNEQWHGKSAALDWDPRVIGSFRLHVVPGDHTSYLGDHVKTAATILQTRLREEMLLHQQ
jgi:amino acid adenylation domain-containing protein